MSGPRKPSQSNKNASELHLHILYSDICHRFGAIKPEYVAVCAPVCKGHWRLCQKCEPHQSLLLNELISWWENRPPAAPPAHSLVALFTSRTKKLNQNQYCARIHSGNGFLATSSCLSCSVRDKTPLTWWARMRRRVRLRSDSISAIWRLAGAPGARGLVCLGGGDRNEVGQGGERLQGWPSGEGDKAALSFQQTQLSLPHWCKGEIFVFINAGWLRELWVVPTCLFSACEP